jgi:hypothetical protein
MELIGGLATPPLLRTSIANGSIFLSVGRRLRVGRAVTRRRAGFFRLLVGFVCQYSPDLLAGFRLRLIELGRAGGRLGMNQLERPHDLRDLLIGQVQDRALCRRVVDPACL